MSSSNKNIRKILSSWLRKSREIKRNQAIIAARLSANFANIELKAELSEMNEVSSYVGESGL